LKGSPLKYLLDLNDSGTWGKDPTGVGDTVVLRSTDISLDGSWRISNPAVRHVNELDQVRKRLAYGDLVVVKSSGSPEHLGKSAIVTKEVAAMRPCFANFVQRLRPSPSTDSRYVWYVLNSKWAADEMASLGNTTTGLRNLNGTIIGSIRVPAREIRKQRAIADFLDRETNRIDTLITKERQVIDLLEERLQTLITTTVTDKSPVPASRDRGRDQNSGSREPSTPHGRHSVTLRRLASTTSGAGFPHAEQGHASGDLPFIKVSDFNHTGNERVITTCNNWVTNQTALRLRATVVPTGSVLLPKVGAALLGNARRIVSQPSVFDNNILGVVPENISSRYLHYWLTTVDAAQFAKPGPVPSMDDSAVLSLRVPVVSRRTQRAIADYLDTETSRLDTLITKKRRMIALLNERRLALITATVTHESTA